MRIEIDKNMPVSSITFLFALKQWRGYDGVLVIFALSGRPQGIAPTQAQ